MKLVYCTITGADDAVVPADLAALSYRYPFVEWGIAYRPDDFGKPRIPTPEWVSHFNSICPSVHKSIHLSGTSLRDFVNDDAIILRHIAPFPRVQLNFNLTTDKSTEGISALKKRIGQMPDKQFIFKLNPDTHPLLRLMQGATFSILYDSSSGHGKCPEQWQSPLPGYFCGYAGGINPDNIQQTLSMLAKVVKRHEKIWIDMETGVRTDKNSFDLKKTVQILEKTKEFIDEWQ